MTNLKAGKIFKIALAKMEHPLQTSQKNSFVPRTATVTLPLIQMVVISTWLLMWLVLCKPWRKGQLPQPLNYEVQAHCSCLGMSVSLTLVIVLTIITFHYKYKLKKEIERFNLIHTKKKSWNWKHLILKKYVLTWK
jgi:hypothetical protein